MWMQYYTFVKNYFSMWQKCPICNGSGSLKTSYLDLDQCLNYTDKICPTCNGERIISSLNGKPPSHKPEPSGVKAPGKTRSEIDKAAKQHKDWMDSRPLKPGDRSIFPIEQLEKRIEEILKEGKDPFVKPDSSGSVPYKPEGSTSEQYNNFRSGYPYSLKNDWTIEADELNWNNIVKDAICKDWNITPEQWFDFLSPKEKEEIEKQEFEDRPGKDHISFKVQFGKDSTHKEDLFDSPEFEQEVIRFFNQETGKDIPKNTPVVNINRNKQ